MGLPLEANASPQDTDNAMDSIDARVIFLVLICISIPGGLLIALPSYILSSVFAEDGVLKLSTCNPTRAQVALLVTPLQDDLSSENIKHVL